SAGFTRALRAGTAKPTGARYGSLDPPLLAHSCPVLVCLGMFRVRMGFAPVERNAMRIAAGTGFKGRGSSCVALVLGLAFSFSQVSLQAASESPAEGASGSKLILVVGAPGESEYGTNFLVQAVLWQKACEKARFGLSQIGLEASTMTNDLEVLRLALASEPREETQPL